MRAAAGAVRRCARVRRGAACQVVRSFVRSLLVPPVGGVRDDGRVWRRAAAGLPGSGACGCAAGVLAEWREEGRRTYSVES